MLRRLSPAIAAALALSASPAAAHPHVFVTVKSTVVYEAEVTKAVRHAWRFDDMFSAFAVQGLDTNGDGKLSREELQPLAEVNVASLKEFDFFTFGKAGSGDIAFNQPVDYWLDYDGTALTLNFTLPVASAPKSDTVRIEIYDPSYFVSFALAKETPAALEGAPEGCRIDAEEPGNQAAPNGRLTEDFFSNLEPGSSWGKQFANIMAVRCGADALAFAETQKPKAPEPALDSAPGPQPAPQDAPTSVEAAPLQQMPGQGSANSGATAKPSGPSLGAFGLVRPDGAASAPGDGVFGWIAQQQSAFYSKMSAALSASKADGSAFLLLAGLSFAYGVFHAAGPGHGKAVISSYLLATGETLRRGIAISFAAAIAQAVTAIAVVGLLAAIVGATSRAMGATAWWLEAASYALIVLLGITLLFRTVRAAVGTLRGEHVHDHSCGPDCGHAHAPQPSALAGEFDWKRAASAVLAIGLRPCTGALIILVFALTQGLIWTGIAATFAMALGTAITVTAIAALAVGAKSLALRLASTSSNGVGTIALHGIEVVAGFAVLGFGLMLLGGLLSSGAPVAG